MQGDGEGRYRVDGFRMVGNGDEWYPPLVMAMSAAQGGQSASSSTSSAAAIIPYPCVLNFKQIKYFT